jgi:oligopeptide transport system substrate-binding protein
LHGDHHHQKNYQLAVASWICQFHDPISLLERFDSNKNSKNYPGWENKEYSLLLEKASQCLNLSERENILKEAEDLLSKDLAIIPLYHWTSPYLCHPRLEAIATTPTGGVLFDQFQMKN